MLRRKTFEVQGMTFQLKPTTRNNVKAMNETFNDPTDELLEMDQYAQYVELLKIIAEPVGEASFEKIDLDEFDLKIAEEALMDFMPTLMGTYSGLIGSSRS